MRIDADQIQQAVCSAMARDGITLEQSAEVARHALAEAKGPVYVVRAFEPKRLVEWLRRLEVEPLAEDTLPLPGAPVGAAKLAQRAKGAVVELGEAAKPGLQACDTCSSSAGDPRGDRLVIGADGRNTWCPDCIPNPA
jgi:hypothetical protein